MFAGRAPQPLGRQGWLHSVNKLVTDAWREGAWTTWGRGRHGGVGDAEGKRNATAGRWVLQRACDGRVKRGEEKSRAL